MIQVFAFYTQLARGYIGVWWENIQIIVIMILQLSFFQSTYPTNRQCKTLLVPFVLVNVLRL